MSLVVEAHFQHILRMFNTNIDGKLRVMYAMNAIRGVGRRFSNVACKKADIDMKKRFLLIFCFALFDCVFILKTTTNEII